MKVSIYGAGYVGLVSAVCLANLGHKVCCCDVDEKKINQLKQGLCPLYERGLNRLLIKNLKSGQIFFTNYPKYAVKHGTVQIIAVGTPSMESGEVDMRFVDQVIQNLITYLSDYATIVIKSTVSVGTADRIFQKIARGLEKRRLPIEFDVVSNPEFLKEGTAVKDFLKPDRIVVGVSSERAVCQMRELYRPLIEVGRPFLVMDQRSAELAKYVSNAFLATKISFINEFSYFTEYFNASIEQVRTVLGLDARVNPTFFNPGCGFGGSCFPKDLLALQKIAKSANIPSSLVDAVIEINERQKLILYHKIRCYFKQQLKGKVVALWGLAFKPGTDDVRFASSRTLMESLWAQDVRVQAYDPLAMKNIRRIYGESDRLKLCQDAYAVLENADVLAIVTEWDEFKEPNFRRIKDKLHYPAIFDGRNIYQFEQVEKFGLNYYAIGLGHPSKQELI